MLTNEIFMYLFIIVSTALIVSLSYIKLFRDKINLLKINKEIEIKTMNKLNDEKTTLEINNNELIKDNENLKLTIDDKNVKIEILKDEIYHLRKQYDNYKLRNDNIITIMKKNKEKKDKEMNLMESKLIKYKIYNENNIDFKKLHCAMKNKLKVFLKNNKKDLKKSIRKKINDICNSKNKIKTPLTNVFLNSELFSIINKIDYVSIDAGQIFNEDVMNNNGDIIHVISDSDGILRIVLKLVEMDYTVNHDHLIEKIGDRNEESKNKETSS